MPNILRQKFEIVISSEGGLHESDIAGAINEGLPRVLQNYRNPAPKFSLKRATLTNEIKVSDLFHLN